MSYKLAEDPFKRRLSNKGPKQPLVLRKTAINQIVSHAHFLESEKKKEDKLQEKKKDREACKELNEAFSKVSQAGEALKRIQYAKDVQTARQELDREAIVEARRNYVLNKAYEKLYKDTDRVKYFQSAKDLSEMLKEREKQVAARLSQQDKRTDYDARFVLGILRDIDAYKDEEKEKVKIKKEKMKRNATAWSKQQKETLQKKVQEKWENLRDGFLIKDEADKEEEKAAEKLKQKQKDIQKYKSSLDNQVKEKFILFDMRQKLEEVEDAKDKLFNDAKREMKLEHQKIESQLAKEKAERNKHVADNMSDEKSIIKAREEAILQKAVQQSEDKAQQEAEKKAAKQSKLLKSIEQFYENQMVLKNKKIYEERLENLRDKRNIDDLVEKLREVEDLKEQKKQQLEKEAQHVQLHQMGARRIEEKSKEFESLKDYLRHMRGLDQEEETFQKYAQKEIEQCEALGIDTYAMKKAARPGIECGKGPLFENKGYIRPRYYASTGSPVDLPHLNRIGDIPDTKSRLGFLL